MSRLWPITLFTAGAVFFVSMTFGSISSGSLIEQHAFRQTQTAISAYWMAKGTSWIAYETPVLGPPWSIPMEFPLYQGLVALFVKAGAKLEIAGRLLSLVFFIGCVALIVDLLRRAGRRNEAWLAGALMFVSPVYLYWSRTFMIESTALFFGLAFLWAFARWINEERIGWLFLATICGVLAALTKITTFVAFPLAALFLLVPKLTRKPLPWVTLLKAGLSVGCAMAIGIAWVRWSDGVKSQNPLADGFITSAALKEWNFGTLAQRFAADSWRALVRHILADAIGSWAGLVAILAALYMADSNTRRWIGGALVTWLFVFLSFTNLHLRHNYYSYSNALFLIVALAFTLTALMNRAGWRGLAIAMLIATVGGSVSRYVYAYRTTTNQPWPYTALAEGAEACSSGNKAYVVLEDDWSSALLYSIGRKGAMLRAFPDQGIAHNHVAQLRSGVYLPNLLQTRETLRAYGLAGAILCGEFHNDRDAVFRFLPELAKAKVSTYAVANYACDLYCLGN